MSFVVGEYAPLQFLTSILFIISGVFGSLINYLPKLYSWLILLFGSLLAMDELLMFHECMKVSLFRGYHSYYLRDITTLIYSIVFLLGTFLCRKYFSWTFVQKISLSLAAVFLIFIIMNDSFGFSFFDNADFFEELAEAVGLGVGLIFLSEDVNFKNTKNKFFFNTVVSISLSLFLGFLFLGFRQELCFQVNERSVIEFYKTWY